MGTVFDDVLAIGRDQDGNEYDVRVQPTRFGGGLVMVVEGTPGRWAISDIEHVRGPLAIDAGRGWMLANASHVVSEVIAALEMEGIDWHASSAAREAPPAAAQDPQTALMYDVGEKTYAEIGERHGYTGIIRGLAEILHRAGFDIDANGMELSTRFHDPLAGFYSEFEKGRVTFGQVADAIDATFLPRRGDTSLLPYPFENIARSGGRLPYPLDRTPSAEPSLSWIKSEIVAHLKKERIRRGTARFKDFVRDSGRKIVDAAIDASRGAVEKASAEADKAITIGEKMITDAHVGLNHARRRAEIRHAILEAAGKAGREEAGRAAAETVAAWEQASLRLGDAIQEIADGKAALDPEKAAVEVMRLDDDLRPFLDAAGVSYELPEWKKAEADAGRASELTEEASEFNKGFDVGYEAMEEIVDQHGSASTETQAAVADARNEAMRTSDPYDDGLFDGMLKALEDQS